LVVTFFGITVFAFGQIHLIPGDPVTLLFRERNVDPAQLAALRTELGLDRPLIVQHGLYVWRALHGDLGTSLATHDSVMDEFLTYFPTTIELAVSAMLLAILLGVPASWIRWPVTASGFSMVSKLPFGDSSAMLSSTRVRPSDARAIASNSPTSHTSERGDSGPGSVVSRTLTLAVPGIRFLFMPLPMMPTEPGNGRGLVARPFSAVYGGRMGEKGRSPDAHQRARSPAHASPRQVYVPDQPNGGIAMRLGLL
jgi:hypothetical protein